MINPEQCGVEEGDEIRLSIEGVVKPRPDWKVTAPGLELHGINLAPWAGVPEVHVEILKKAAPKWHSAQVIRAKGFPESWPATPAYEGVFMRRENSILWIDPSGENWEPEELRDVEVIVQ